MPYCWTGKYIGSRLNNRWPWAASAPAILELASHDVAVLAETPPAEDLDALTKLWKELPANARVQVAEQYQFQPGHAARLALTRSGLLGEISQAQISVAHGYHGVSLIRKFLNIGFKNPSIHALQFKSPIVAGSTRAEPPQEERKILTTQTIATLEFEGKLAVSILLKINTFRGSDRTVSWFAETAERLTIWISHI